jgi:hypothetical protein
VAPRARRGGFVLDSHALLAYFEGEASGALVRTLIQDAEQRRIRLYVSLINWGEVFRSGIPPSAAADEGRLDDSRPGR